MDIILYPRAAPGDCVRVWVGVFQTPLAPALKWFLDDAPAAPAALRPLSSVRTDDMLPAGVSPGDLPRAFTGVYEFTGLQPETYYTVRVESGNDKATLGTRTLPLAVPKGLDGRFNVLLVSCFHQAEDRGGLGGVIVSQLKSTLMPHLTLLLGDQVYLDLPTLKDFPDDLAWLADKFERDYMLNWRGPLGYAGVLRAAPSVSVPDDHEYWNNYPHPSPFVGNSLSPEGRGRWLRAASAAYEAFQLPYPARIGEPVVVEVEPLSFFLADTRTNKDPDRRFTMTEEAHRRLDEWVSGVIEKKGFGVFVSGQSLFSKSVGKIAGAVGDYDLPNYGDYGRIMLTLQRLAEAGRPVLCLTGDVHWGRVVTSVDKRTGRTAFGEVISSPVSLVSTVGLDQIKEAGAFVGGLFGSKNPWPRHADPDKPPDYLASEFLQKRFQCKTLQRQKGNHVALLSFRRQGGGLELRVQYWPISRDKNMARPVEVETISMVSA